MAIKAVIFDLGGVLLEIDWEKYREDESRFRGQSSRKRPFLPGSRKVLWGLVPLR